MEYRNIRGQKIPVLGFGTWELSGQSCEQSVEAALQTGYRHIDTARIYGNEKEVGRAIHSSGINRDELFITSKAWKDDFSPKGIHKQIDQSLRELQLDYLDLYLLHWPNPDFSHQEALEALDEAKQKGLIRHAGVSNFSSSQVEDANAVTEIFCNQVEYHPFQEQSANCEVARQRGFCITAYSPLAKGGVFKNPLLREIGEKHEVNAGQVALRWLIQQDSVIAIPRSQNPDHIRSNFEVFGFELDEEEMNQIFELAKTEVE